MVLQEALHGGILCVADETCASLVRIEVGR
jgi:hypothetical protein